MRRRLLTCSILILGLLALSQSAQAITYNVNRVIGAGTVLGTVTTDGTIGLLDETNFLAWSLTIDEGDGQGPFLLTEANSEAIVQTSSNLSATATELLYDFVAPGWAAFQNPAQSSGINFWCVGLCTGPGSPIEAVMREGTFFSGESVSKSGVHVIASTVPEPTTALLLACGLVGIGVRRRH